MKPEGKLPSKTISHAEKQQNKQNTGNANSQYWSKLWTNSWRQTKQNNQPENWLTNNKNTHKQNWNKIEPEIKWKMYKLYTVPVCNGSTSNRCRSLYGFFNDVKLVLLGSTSITKLFDSLGVLNSFTKIKSNFKLSPTPQEGHKF